MALKVLIVGGGLAGSIPAAALKKAGVEFELFDDNQEYGASRASENLFSKNWGKTLGNAVTVSGISVLERLYKTQTIPFNTGKHINHVLHIPACETVWKTPTRKRVVKVSDGFVVTEDGEEYRGVVLVAAGVWSRNLLPQMKSLTCLSGHGLIFKGTLTKEPLMDFWAPYRHRKIFQRAPGEISFGDTTCISEKNYDPKTHVAASIKRANDAGLDPKNLLKILYGHRPYYPAQKKGFYSKLSEKLYVSTSGWNFGLVIYAHQTERFMKDIGVWS